MGELDRSEEAFERSLRANEDAIVLNNHAYFMATRKDVEATPARLARALECSTRANELKPQEGNFMDTQAYVLFMMGSHEEALQWILDAQENGMAGDPVALSTKATFAGPWATRKRRATRGAGLWRPEATKRC